MSETQKYRQVLISGLQELQCQLSDQQIDQLLDYHALLVKWNKAYNLTAVRDPLEMITRHVLDSLTIVPFLEGERFIDVGTGAGLPGIVLAIVFPQHQFALLDSAGKKMRFLFQVKTELALSNVSVHHIRVESYQPEQRFDGVISRAFASLLDMVSGCSHLLSDDGYFYAMKGQYPADEVEQLKSLSDREKAYKVEACHPLRVPGEPAQRHLLLISQQSSLS